MKSENSLKSKVAIFESTTCKSKKANIFGHGKVQVNLFRDLRLSNADCVTL